MINEPLTRRFSPAANRRAGPATTLQGVKRRDWRARPEAARGLGRKLAGRGEIAYWVVSPEGLPPEVRGAERRGRPREQTRLRSAKVLDGAYRFLCEGRICDRSPEGLRLALARDIALPLKFAVHIDETSEVREAKVVWRRGATVGVRLSAPAPEGALRPCDRYALKERYYAISG
jgi:PilZ domain